MANINKIQKQPWVHLHGHTEFSLRDTAGRAHEIVTAAAEQGFESICVTDHGTISGWLDIRKACQEKGIKPLFGIEFYMVPWSRKIKGVTKEEEKQFQEEHGRKMLKDEKKALTKYRGGASHLIALAYNDQGVKNLIQLSSDAHINGKYKVPRTDWDMLRTYSEGLILSTACGNGLLARPYLKGNNDVLEYNVRMLKEIFPGRAFLELQMNDWEKQLEVNRKIVEIAQQHGLPLSLTQDFHYPYAKDKPSREYIKMIDYGIPYTEWDHSGKHTMHVCNYEEAKGFWERFGHAEALGWDVFHQALANTQWVESQIQADFDPGGRKFPSFPVPQGYATSLDFFNACVQEGWQRRLPFMQKSGKAVEEYQKRLQHEIQVIQSMGYVDYFLIVRDFNVWAKSNGLACGPARGSAAGCLLSWVLGITEIDPLRFGLSFERFLNPEREKAPDIDSDFSDVDRHAVKEYLKHRWGEDKFATIGTYSRYKPKMLFQDICKTHNVEVKKMFAISKALNNEVSFSSNAQSNSNLRALIEERGLHDIVPAIDRMYHQIRHVGQAAAGVIISDVPLIGVIPLRTIGSGDSRTVITEFDGDRVEDMGMLKMDVLAITELRILSEASKSIDYIQQYNKQVGRELQWFYDQCPLDDVHVWDAFCRGETKNVFQMGGDSITDLTQKVGPRNILELSAIQALHRPQPLELKYDERYWRRKHGQEPVTSIHPFIDDIFSETYGVMVFQEQFIEMVSRLGLSYGKADILRRLCEDIVKATKKERAQPKYDKIMEELLNSSVPAGITNEERKKIVDEVARTVGYSFNKCVDGGTVIERGSKGRYGGSLTISHLYHTYHNIEYAKKAGSYALRKKLRREGWGKCLGMDVDGRIRPLPIKDVLYSGKKRCAKIVLEDGKQVVASWDHWLYSNRGWQQVKSLLQGDFLCADGGYDINTSKSGSKRIKDETPRYRGRGLGYKGRGFPKGSSNPGWVDGRCAIFEAFRTEAIDQKKPCDLCGKTYEQSKHVFEADHISAFEFQWLCNSCHKKEEYTRGRTKQWQKGHKSLWSSIVEIVDAGEKETYDIEMDHEEHNYLANGIMSHNSHSLAYSLVAYFCQYMKVYHAGEFWLAVLNAELTKTKDKRDISKPLMSLSQSLASQGKKMNVTVGNINSFSDRFSLVHDEYGNPWLYFALLLADGVAELACNKLKSFVLEQGPFSTLEDFFMKDKLPVNITVQRQLVNIGVFDGFPLSVENPVVMNRMQMLEWIAKKKEANTKKKLREIFSKGYQPVDKEFTLMNQAECEMAAFKMAVTHNPWHVYAPVLDKLKQITLQPGQKRVLGAWVDAKRDERGKGRTDLVLETNEGRIEAVAWDNDFRSGLKLEEGKVYIWILQQSQQAKYRPSIKKVIPLSVEDPPKLYGFQER